MRLDIYQMRISRFIHTIIVLVFSMSTLLLNAQTFEGEWQWANGITSQFNSSTGFDWQNRQNMTVDDKGNVYTLSSVYFNNITLKPYNESRIDTMGQSGRDLILSKYNCSGDLVWWKTIASKFNTGNILSTGNEYLNGEYPTDGSLICDNEGHIFLSFTHGFQDSLILLDTIIENDPLMSNWMLLKVDTNGILIDYAQYERLDSIYVGIYGWSTSSDNEVYAITQIGNLSNQPSDYSSIPSGKIRAAIGKLDKQTMEFNWIKLFDPHDEVMGIGLKLYDIVVDHNENLIVGGFISDSMSIFGEEFYNLNRSLGYEEYREAFIAKFDTLGNLGWFSRARQASPNDLDTFTLIIENALSVDENNNVYTTLHGQRAFFDGVTPNPISGSSKNVVKLNGNTGIAEWILYANKVGFSDQWFPQSTHYRDGVLYCGGYHGTAKIDSTIFSSITGAFDPLLIAVDPTTGELLEWLKIPADGGSHSMIMDIQDDENGNLFLDIMQNGTLFMAGFDTIAPLLLGRPTGLIAKYGEANCVCSPPSLSLDLLQVDTANLEVSFNVNATNYDNLTWDFGDGNLWLDTSVTSANYTFANDTNYQVCVTALSDDCGSATSCMTIDLYVDIQDTTIIDTTIIDTTIIDTTGVGIRDIYDDNWGISVYPNPVEDKLFLEFSGAMLDGEKDVLLYDVTGQLKAQTQLKGRQHKMYMDLSVLEPGVYILSVNNGAHYYQDKLIIQK